MIRKLIASALAGILLLNAASAAVVNGTPANYLTLLATLGPGDTLQLSTGTYTGGLPISSKAGTASQPIIISGPGDQSAVFAANDCCNTIELDTVSYTEIRNLTLDGQGTNGAFGVDSRGSTHHITIENLRIVNYGADQQIVGIGTKGPAWNWTVRGNTIIGAGTGMYFGNSDGTQPFVAGLIENNLVLDTIGYNLQIKHQAPRPTNVGLPTGDSVTIVRNNVFSKQNNGSTGSNARPNMLVGHFPLSGAGVNDRYEVYGNFFYQNPTEALFQGEGNIALYSNMFVNAAGDAVNIQPQNDVPRNVTVFNNTVVASGGGLRINGGAVGYSQQLVGNASFAATPLAGPNQQDNVTGTYPGATTYLNNPTAPIDALDLFPKTGQLSGATLNLVPFSALTAYDRDFNGVLRTGEHRGAYEGDGANPGWKLGRVLKSSAGVVPVTPTPTLSLTASATQVLPGGSVTLQWSTTNATGCTASGAWSGSRGTSGSTSTGAIAVASTYTLTCTGAGGSASQIASVSLLPPAVTLGASASSVIAGASVTLNWGSSGATACTASGSWSGSKATIGTEIVGPLQANSTFALTCTGAGGSGSQTAAVQVTASGGQTSSSSSTASSSSSSGSSSSASSSSSSSATASSSSSSATALQQGNGSSGGGGLGTVTLILLAMQLLAGHAKRTICPLRCHTLLGRSQDQRPEQTRT